MDLVTVILSMSASAALTLGLVYFIVWLRQGASPANLWFAIASLSGVGLATAEFIMLQAPSAAAYGDAQRWGQLALVSALGSLTWFAHFYFRVKRGPWPWLICGWLGLVLAINFAGPYGIHYQEITALVSREMLGQTLQVAVGTPGRWRRLGELGAAMVICFVLYAAISAWRRNDYRDRSRALVVGLALSVFLIVLASQLFLVNTGRVDGAILLGPLFMIPVVAMAYKLSVELLLSSRLATELDESRERLALAADAAHLDFWEYDPARDRFWISERLLHLAGFAPGQPVSLAAWLDRIHPDDRREIAEKAARLLKEGGRQTFEYRIHSADDEIHWFSGRARYLPGRGANAYGINLDVTAERQRVHELDQLQRQLAHASRVAMLGQLASALAHELNQPLGAILRNTEAAQLLLASAYPDQGQLRAILEDILRDDRRAGEVISRLRRLFKHQASEHRAVDFMALADDVTALLRSEATMRRISLSKELEPGAAIVRGDPIHLQQVLLNLVINGMDALDAHGSNERSVCISASRRDDGMLAVCVSDSGPGVSPDLVKSIFEPFYTTKSTGMGVGLSICRTIIESHGGKIWVDTQAGPGSAFRFTLPLEPAPLPS